MVTPVSSIDFTSSPPDEFSAESNVKEDDANSRASSGGSESDYEVCLLEEDLPSIHNSDDANEVNDNLSEASDDSIASLEDELSFTLENATEEDALEAMMPNFLQEHDKVQLIPLNLAFAIWTWVHGITITAFVGLQHLVHSNLMASNDILLLRSLKGV